MCIIQHTKTNHHRKTYTLQAANVWMETDDQKWNFPAVDDGTTCVKYLNSEIRDMPDFRFRVRIKIGFKILQVHHGKYEALYLLSDHN